MKSIETFLRKAYQSDHILEILFSSLRWFFLILAVAVFTIKYYQQPMDYHVHMFIFLVVFGIVYMAISDISLHKSPEGSTFYRVMTKGGPIFDYFAFIFLVALTGGIHSPLFPIAFLIILHVAVYWKFTGALIASIMLMVGHTIIIWAQGFPSTPLDLILYVTQLFFLFFIGFLGGLIVSRERKHYSEKTMLEVLAQKDYLTDLYNHRTFQEHLRENIDKGREFYLVIADIDGFKKVNDNYGHVTGDLVLKAISNIMKNNIPDNLGTVYRYGGDEFAMILLTDDQSEVETQLMNIKEKVSEKVYTASQKEFTVTMSFGSCENFNYDPNHHVEVADKLLYQAKEQGRNRIVLNNEPAC